LENWLEEFLVKTYFLSLFSDRYISGDKAVSLIGSNTLTTTMKQVFGESIDTKKTMLSLVDKPNYAVVYVV